MVGGIQKKAAFPLSAFLPKKALNHFSFTMSEMLKARVFSLKKVKKSEGKKLRNAEMIVTCLFE